MQSQKEVDSDADTGKSLKPTPSTEINVYVSPHEKGSDGSRLEEEKESKKNTEAPVKRSLFKAYKNYSS